MPGENPRVEKFEGHPRCGSVSPLIDESHRGSNPKSLPRLLRVSGVTSAVAVTFNGYTIRLLTIVTIRSTVTFACALRLLLLLGPWLLHRSRCERSGPPGKKTRSAREDPGGLHPGGRGRGARRRLHLERRHPAIVSHPLPAGPRRTDDFSAKTFSTSRDTGVWVCV